MKYIIPFAAGLLLMFLFMRTCNPAPVSLQPKVDSLNKVVSIQRQHAKDDSLHYIAIITTKQDSINWLLKVTAQTYDSLHDVSAKAKYYLAKYRISVLAKDTISIVTDCAAFVDQAQQFYDLAIAYRDERDSIDALRMSLDSTKSGEIARLNKLIVDKDNNYDALNHFFQEQLKVDADLRKQLARTKRGRWVIAAVAGIGGALIGHAVK